MTHAPKTLLGHVQCPECDHPDAEVKTDKAGHPYRFCPECNAQTFTRGHAKRAKNMLAKMRPVGASVAPGATSAPPGPQNDDGGAPVVPADKKPTTERRRGATLLG